MILLVAATFLIGAIAGFSAGIFAASAGDIGGED